MTEKLLSIAPQIAIPAHAAFTSSIVEAIPIVESVDEEPYTIKCICDYSDDDGNTIYCETCDTWQHIECFYPGRVEQASRDDFDHSCADCKPRSLDKRLATERQRQTRQEKLANENGDKKNKRPPSKSHKKKARPTEVQTNGHHDNDGHRNGSPHEHHTHSKKAKGHRPTQSINTHLKRSPPLNGRSHSVVHPPSPAHTPPDLPSGFQYHTYSDDFRRLYSNHPVDTSCSTNSFANLSVSNTMTSWLRDPERLKQDVGLSKEEVFQSVTVSVDNLLWPEINVETKDSHLQDMPLQWRQLVTPAFIPQEGRIGELNGLIGLQAEYCINPDNRWQETIHPRPFVFFPLHLPLSIDTRQEGSKYRYVRRSCRPNASLETFIANGTEYHFWLISERPLLANEQITIPWDFRLPARLKNPLNLGDDDSTSFDGADINEEDYYKISETIRLVLSDHGGCACDLGNDCAFARFHRNYYARMQQSNGTKPKKGARKIKQNHTSPSSTGHATNSRAASEGQHEQYDEEDNKSMSGSTHSKPNSLDLTPAHGAAETNGIIAEPSERDKRKLAMVEDSFRKLEQGQPPRKKKRASDGSNVGILNQHGASNTTTKPRQKSIAPRNSVSQASNANGPRARQYVDASTSRRQSGSPYSAGSPTATGPSPRNQDSKTVSAQHGSRQTSATPKATYADSSTQTDDVDNAWWKDPRPKKKRSIIPLAKRLLNNRHRLQARQDEASAQQQSLFATSNGNVNENGQTSPTTSMDLDIPLDSPQANPASPTLSHARKASISSWSPASDTPSTAIDAAMPDAPPAAVANSTKPPPPPWPSQTISSNGPFEPTPFQKSDLRVQLPPNIMLSATNLSPQAPSSATPSSATGSVAQSPFGTTHLTSPFPPATINGLGQQASPVKPATKKLSLKEYQMSRKKTTDSSLNRVPSGDSPTMVHTVLKQSLSDGDDIKIHSILEESALVESPPVVKDGLQVAAEQVAEAEA